MWSRSSGFGGGFAHEAIQPNAVLEARKSSDSKEEPGMLDIIAKFTTAENVSYALYDTGYGNGAYIVRDEDPDQLVARVNGRRNRSDSL